MSFLHNHLTTRYSTIEAVITLNDVAASHFKQEYLFSNLNTWEQNTQTKIIWIFYPASRGKEFVNGLGGIVEHSVRRSVKACGNTPLDAISFSEIAPQQTQSKHQHLFHFV